MIGSLRAESDLTDEQTAHFIEVVLRGESVAAGNYG